MEKQHQSRGLFSQIFHTLLFISGTIFCSCFLVDSKLGVPFAKQYETNYPIYVKKHTTAFLEANQIDRTKYLHRIIPSEQEELLITKENVILSGGAVNILYFSQNDPRWQNKTYGPYDSIGVYGCGPTALSMLVSSLTEENITPDKMAEWAYQNGFHSSKSGSYHSIIPNGAASFGLKAESITDYSSQNLIQELSTGKIIVALMDEGHFTAHGHFIILRGVTLDGKVLIADPKSLENSLKEWDLDIILEEAKYHASSGGPMWSIYK